MTLRYVSMRKNESQSSLFAEQAETEKKMELPEAIQSIAEAILGPR